GNEEKSTMILITGGGRGIGLATAEKLVRRGNSVVIHGGHDPEQLRQSTLRLRSMVRHPDQRVESILTDLSDPESVVPFCETVWEMTGGVTGLVAAAGSDILTHGASRWPFERRLNALLSVDLIATAQIARWFGARIRDLSDPVSSSDLTGPSDSPNATDFPNTSDFPSHIGSAISPVHVVPSDERIDRSIVLIGWSGVDHGTKGDGGQLFGLAKGAIHGFSRSLAKSLAPEVRVNVVAPGWIRTGWGEQTSTRWRNHVRRTTSLERWGTPEEVASLIVFLLSPKSSYLNGTIIPVDGMVTE
ncbi:MAG: SDR family oxidoreductase, partial [Planctomycetia bacterium]|nr:SDR family oxidoreductase [Planctomycetia bacterium]